MIVVADTFEVFASAPDLTLIVKSLSLIVPLPSLAFTLMVYWVAALGVTFIDVPVS